MSYHRLGFFLLPIFLFYSAPQARDLYAAMGDSITAGARANTSVRKNYQPILDKIENPNAEENLDNNKDFFSWATGIKLLSQQIFLNKYLLKKSQNTVGYINVAEGGKSSQDMPGQALLIQKEMAKKNYQNLVYVTLLIGANDLCQEYNPTPDEVFESSLMRAFEILSDIPQRKPIQILVMGIPNIAALGSPEIRQAKVGKGPNCQKVREILGIEKACEPILKWETEEEYLEGKEIVGKQNRLIQEIIRKASEKFSNLKFAFSNGLFEGEPSINDLAADCFHPNAKGQEKISKLAWMTQPWFRNK